jgi:SAM-dependent methyltransferase
VPGRYRDYDPFAWLYANYWGADFHSAIPALLDRALLSHLRPGACILDLCCGDGRLAAFLQKKGFDVTGLDGSEQMLSFARQRCPKVRFLLADARDFKLPPTFDAVVSTYDSLNHVMNVADLTRVFRCVWACLKTPGVFLFDLNGEEAYQEVWPKSTVAVDDRVVGVAEGFYSPASRLARCDVTLLRLERGQWKRSDFQLKQRFHPQETVFAALRKVGFQAEAHPASDLGMKGSMGFGRDVYLARKV